MRRTHGESCNPRTTEYSTWAQMVGRCTNSNIPDYEYYGARGIRVCSRWKQYENFLADMGRKPTPRHSIDRIDNNGNYEPGNCRWATVEEQARNHRDTKLREDDVAEIKRLVASGVTQAEAGRQFGVTQAHVSNIVNGYVWKEELCRSNKT